MLPEGRLIRSFDFGVGSLAWLPNVDRGGVQHILDMRRIKFLDHLDAGAAVFGQGVDVCSIDQSKADVGVAKGVKCSDLPLTIELQIFLFENFVEETVMVSNVDLSRNRSKVP